MNTDKNYYDVLGVNSKASASEIKQSYRDLAKKFHPDKNPGDKKSEEKFKQISEAFDTIGDEQKRQEYDQARANPFRGRSQYQQKQRTQQPDLEDLFSSFFGANNARERAKPEPTNIKLKIPFELAIEGGEYIYKTPTNKTLKLKIPANCPIDHKLKITGQGSSGEDIILSLFYDLPKAIELDGNNVIQHVPISIWDALLGSKVEIELYNKKRIALQIKEGTASHQRFKLAGLGLLKDSNRGDCYIEINITLPKNINDYDKEIIKQLKENYIKE
jgi:curved DNA-binding protein